MNCRPARKVISARHIARAARKQINDKTGITVDLVLGGNTGALTAPRRMLRVIAIALNMSPDAYKLRSRVRNIVELRFLGAHFLRTHFPMVTLHQIASLFGGQDHTSVMSGLIRAHNLIHTGDTRFMHKYNTVLNSVNLWLEREVSGYASAISA